MRDCENTHSERGLAPGQSGAVVTIAVAVAAFATRRQAD